MTFHRSPTLVGYAAGSLKSLAAIPVDSVGAGMAGVLAVLGAAFGAANVALLWVVGLAMLLDLIAGALKAVIDPLRKFDGAKLYGGFLGKLFRLLLVPTASLVDWLYIASPLPLPHGYAEAYPVTAFALVALAAAEITSTLDKLKDGGVAPGLISVVMRHLDRIKAGEEPPTRRHYDLPAIYEQAEGDPPTPQPRQDP